MTNLTLRFQNLLHLLRLVGGPFETDIDKGASHTPPPPIPTPESETTDHM